ncbi:hypothetical protein COK68_28255 [Priestia megaterium]|nr:hypothetical protein CN510_16660 [Priestia megaterium]PFT49782.1 hypothetical protein COK68_28255 [Priestia megaterium]
MHYIKSSSSLDIRHNLSFLKIKERSFILYSKKTNLKHLTKLDSLYNKRSFDYLQVIHTQRENFFNKPLLLLLSPSV